VFHLLALVLLLLAILVRRNRTDIILAVVLFVIVTVQFSLPEAQEDAPGVAALHVVNALFIWIVGYHLAMRALVARFRGDPLEAAPARSPIDTPPPPAADTPQQP
jgi:cytochrome b561